MRAIEICGVWGGWGTRTCSPESLEHNELALVGDVKMRRL
jgi:hypothetical protein